MMPLMWLHHLTNDSCSDHNYDHAMFPMMLMIHVLMRKWSS